MFGLTFDKLLLIGFVALIIVGPTRLPGYATKLAQFVKTAKSYADGAKKRLSDEMGPEFEEMDWKKLDPRQYDPRRIIASALLDDEPALPSPIHRVGSRHAPDPAEDSSTELAEVRRGEKTPTGTAE